MLNMLGQTSLILLEFPQWGLAGIKWDLFSLTVCPLFHHKTSQELILSHAAPPAHKHSCVNRMSFCAQKSNTWGFHVSSPKAMSRLSFFCPEQWAGSTQKWAELAPNTRGSSCQLMPGMLHLCSGLSVEISSALSTENLKSETFQAHSAMWHPDNKFLHLWTASQHVREKVPGRHPRTQPNLFSPSQASNHPGGLLFVLAIFSLLYPNSWERKDQVISPLNVFWAVFLSCISSTHLFQKGSADSQHRL